MFENEDSGKESIEGYLCAYNVEWLNLWLSLQAIESVEQEVERLLDEDTLATEVKYGAQVFLTRNFCL